MSSVPQTPDECFRCGYNLLGILNDRPCPECGLLAERSRRVTDELHETRPKWLRKLSIGLTLILISIVSALAWTPTHHLETFNLYTGDPQSWQRDFVDEGLEVFALIFFVGVICLTAREGYAPADRKDRWLRWGLRLAGLSPLISVTLAEIYNQWSVRYWSGFTWSGRMPTGPPPDTTLIFAAFWVATIGSAPLTLLLFLRLRGLAKRARSAHLAEHCLIVGIGTAVSVLYINGVLELLQNAHNWGLGDYWVERSHIVQFLLTVVCVAAFLFIFWSLYLLVRFALAFSRAARESRRKWKRDDLSLAQPG